MHIRDIYTPAFLGEALDSLRSWLTRQGIPRGTVGNLSAQIGKPEVVQEGVLNALLSATYTATMVNGEGKPVIPELGGHIEWMRPIDSDGPSAFGVIHLDAACAFEFEKLRGGQPGSPQPLDARWGYAGGVTEREGVLVATTYAPCELYALDVLTVIDTGAQLTEILYAHASPPLRAADMPLAEPDGSVPLNSFHLFTIPCFERVWLMPAQYNNPIESALLKYLSGHAAGFDVIYTRNDIMVKPLVTKDAANRFSTLWEDAPGHIVRSSLVAVDACRFERAIAHVKQQSQR